MRTLVIIIALALIVMIIKRLWQAPRSSDRSGQSGKPSGNTVQCANCGVYIPVEDKVFQDFLTFVTFYWFLLYLIQT